MKINNLLKFANEITTRTDVLSLDEIIDNMTKYSKDEVEVDDDTQSLEPASRKEALKASLTIKSFLLQYQKAAP